MNQLSVLHALASDPNISPAFKAALCPQRRWNDPKPAEASHLDAAPAVALRPDVPTEAEPNADELAAGRALVTFDATAFCRRIGRTK